jgi:hypothetical protein
MYLPPSNTGLDSGLVRTYCGAPALHDTSPSGRSTEQWEEFLRCVSMFRSLPVSDRLRADPIVAELLFSSLFGMIWAVYACVFDSSLPSFHG